MHNGRRESALTAGLTWPYVSRSDAKAENAQRAADLAEDPLLLASLPLRVVLVACQ